MNEYREEEYKGFKISWYYDECPESPREWCNVAHMICWHGRYNLGDNHKYKNPEDLFRNLVYDYCASEEVNDYCASHIGDCYLEWHQYTQEELDGLKGFTKEQYPGYYTVHSFSSECDYDYECYSIEELFRDVDMVDFLSMDDMEYLLCNKIAILPLSMYEHGGATIWAGSPSDPWDSGYIGYIYQTKEDTLKNWKKSTDKNWRNIAFEHMEKEIEVYDQYIRGDVYRYEITDVEGHVIDACSDYYGDESIEDQMEECYKIIDDEIERRSIQAEIDWENNIINNVIDFTMV